MPIESIGKRAASQEGRGVRRSAASFAVFDPCVCGKASFRTAGSADVRAMGNATPLPAGVAMPPACAPFASAIEHAPHRGCAMPSAQVPFRNHAGIGGSRRAGDPCGMRAPADRAWALLLYLPA